jgi:hypothetical protein
VRPPWGIMRALEKLSEIALARRGIYPKGPIILGETRWDGETLSWVCNVDGKLKTFDMVEPVDMLIRASEMVAQESVADAGG